MTALSGPSRLWVPPAVSRELREESLRREAQTMQALADDHRYEWKRRFDAQLGRVVDGMRLALCPDPAPLDAVAQGARPGCWHVAWPAYKGGPVVNLSPLAVDTATGLAALGGDGAPVEPGSWVFDELARQDLWNEQSVRERNRRVREATEAKRRRREQEIAEFDAETLEHYKAVSRAQISMNRGVSGDKPFAQNMAGARRSRGEPIRRPGGGAL
jgi:hypothetical protein